MVYGDFLWSKEGASECGRGGGKWELWELGEEWELLKREGNRKYKPHNSHNSLA